MWSRVRHRRLQALSLVALAALLTTSFCLGPLYQRAMEQALSASVVAAASPEQKALRISSTDLSTGQLVADLPSGLGAYVGGPVSTASANVEVVSPGGVNLATRLYSASGACEQLRVVDGACPRAAGEVMVSSGDVADNGWTVGTEVDVTERVDLLFDGTVRTRGHRDHGGCLRAGARRRLARRPAHRSGRPRGAGCRAGHRRLGDRRGHPARVIRRDVVPRHELGRLAAGHRRPRRPGRGRPHRHRLPNGDVRAGRERHDPHRDRPAEPVPAGRRRERPGADHGGGPGGPAAGPGRGGALDGARRGHRRSASRGRAGAVAGPRPPRCRGLPARRAVAAHPERGGDRRARRTPGDEPGRPGGLPGDRAARAAGRVPARGARLHGRGAPRGAGGVAASRARAGRLAPARGARPGTPAPAPGPPRSR